MGLFEKPQYAAGTMHVAQAVADCPGFTVIGGGDSVSAINKGGFASQVSHICTGGGASLEYLAAGKLPGVTALERDA
jgi:phosphoglycerate kinase